MLTFRIMLGFILVIGAIFVAVNLAYGVSYAANGEMDLSILSFMATMIGLISVFSLYRPVFKNSQKKEVEDDVVVSIIDIDCSQSSMTTPASLRIVWESPK